MDPRTLQCANETRRQFFGKSATGIGTAALASLLGREKARGSDPLGSPIAPGFAPKAKRVIYLFMNGAPTHSDLYDYKPEMVRRHATPMPKEFFAGKRFSTMTGDPSGKVVLAPVEPFHRRGASGAWVSDFLPHIAGVADKLCFVKSMHTEAVNHAPGVTFLLTGSEMAGRPSMGAWLTYGLGSATDELPGFCVMTSVSKGTTCGQIFYDYYWGSGFLPSRYQGVKFRAGGDPVLYLSSPKGVSRKVRRGILDDIARLNELQLAEFADPEIATRIAQYELGYKMQASVPELTDLSHEPQSVLDLYGPQVRERGTFAHNCLMARRLIEPRHEICPVHARRAGINTTASRPSFTRSVATPTSRPRASSPISLSAAYSRTRS